MVTLMFILFDRIQAVCVQFYFLKRATRWHQCFLHEQDARSCSRWSASDKQRAACL